jgi:Nucleotidyl transferase AbiEii toxin, Type IV TA system
MRKSDRLLKRFASGTVLGCLPMFRLELHQKIATVLNCINPNFLQECGALFGGGTQLALKYDEYRCSQDIDFLCPVGDGYRFLRRMVAEAGYGAIFIDRTPISLPRDIQANQYGVRFPVVVDGTTIKLELVIEGRISLGQPEYFDWSPIPCLNPIDRFAEKLLANADRWLDASIESRDLIDLAVLRRYADLPQAAIIKAESAYPVIEPLKRAILNFQDKPDYRVKCYKSLIISSPPNIVDGLDLLASDFGLASTARLWIETANG